MNDSALLKSRLTQQARAEGFAAMGVCAPDAADRAGAGLRAFLEAGAHGQMGWMAERVEWRASAAALWPEARSIIMLAEVYTPPHDPRDVVVMLCQDIQVKQVFVFGF
ncbi:MAG: hypothetical protein EBU97_04380 [Rhodobacteraceae bacterium]|nr:hypothetical protein [Paracoccaceae bacterium]